MSKFAIQASESAPKNYPMEITSGYLHYPEGGSLYIPNKKTIHNGWGEGWSSHVVGDELKPLPNKLSIGFFSYTENKFYTGDFDLPYEKLVQYFKDGYFGPNEQKRVTYRTFIVGVAPGGVVSVWIQGRDRRTEIFHGLAKEHEGNWKLIIDNPKFTREEYIRLNLEESLKPDAFENLMKTGVPFGLWTKYHKTRYQWDPVFINMPIYDGFIDNIEYYNGEREAINYPLDDDQKNLIRAVPSFLDFTWDRPNAKPLRIKLYFDEPEIFTAFETVGKDNLPMNLEMRMASVNGKNDFTVWLTNKKRELEIKKLNVKTYGIPNPN